jgi:hypothetical protein
MRSISFLGKILTMGIKGSTMILRRKKQQFVVTRKSGFPSLIGQLQKTTSPGFGG